MATTAASTLYANPINKQTKESGRLIAGDRNFTIGITISENQTVGAGPSLEEGRKEREGYRGDDDDDGPMS